MVQTLLMRFCLTKQHKAVITNSRELLYHEADLVSVTRAGLVHEYEIKLSRADYMRDFRNKKAKHWNFENGGVWKYMPAYFWFVTHGFEIEPPSYAGWMKVIANRWGKWVLDVKKEAPRMKADKWDDAKVAKIARLLSYRLLTEYERTADGAT